MPRAAATRALNKVVAINLRTRPLASYRISRGEEMLHLPPTLNVSIPVTQIWLRVGCQFPALGAAHFRRIGATLVDDFRGSYWVTRMLDFERFDNFISVVKPVFRLIRNERADRHLVCNHSACGCCVRRGSHQQWTARNGVQSTAVGQAV